MEYQKECYHLGVKRSRKHEKQNPQTQCKYCDEIMDKNLLSTHMNRFLQYLNFLVYILTDMAELLQREYLTEAGTYPQLPTQPKFF